MLYEFKKISGIKIIVPEHRIVKIEQVPGGAGAVLTLTPEEGGATQKVKVSVLFEALVARAIGVGAMVATSKFNKEEAS